MSADKNKAAALRKAKEEKRKAAETAAKNNLWCTDRKTQEECDLPCNERECPKDDEDGKECKWDPGRVANEALLVKMAEIGMGSSSGFDTPCFSRYISTLEVAKKCSRRTKAECEDNELGKGGL